MKPIYLENILEKKRERLNKERNPSSFFEALSKDGLSIIGEVKKASPSKGLICENFQPEVIAGEYDSVVDAMSVLTEEDYFLGKLAYLEKIFNSTHIPLLCKDFFLEKNQIIKARASGASAILLIVHILTDDQLKKLFDFATLLGLDVLVEAHTKEEVKRALKINPKIIGINNRDLKTFDIDIKVTEACMPLIPDNIVKVSESGISKREDITFLKKTGVDAILVGESFMRAPSITELAKEFREAYDKS